MMRNDTRKYLNKENELCKEIWDEHLNNKDNALDHYHICDFELNAMLTRYKKSYRKSSKEWQKKCTEYLTSIEHERDTKNWYSLAYGGGLDCCDECPHMRYLTLTEDGYFINIARPALDKFCFEEEKDNEKVLLD